MLDTDTSLLMEAYQQIVERVIKRTGPKTVDRQDISNFIYKITNGGKELFSIYTIRKGDSKTDPKKRAGMSMKITGKYGACKASLRAAQTRRPELNAKVQYAKNAILRMCVTEVDGVDYVSRFSPENRTRSYDVTNIIKIEAGGETYDVV
jgi:hypothetical protein